MRKRIFAVCFMGSLIGGLVSLHLQWHWLIGATVGGLIGYIGYDIKEFWQACRTTWTQMVTWRPDTDNWLHGLIYVIGSVLWVGGFLTFLLVVVGFLAWLNPSPTTPDLKFLPLLFGLSILLLVIAPVVAGVTAGQYVYNSKIISLSYVKREAMDRMVWGLIFNPFTAVLVLPWLLPLAVVIAAIAIIGYMLFLFFRFLPKFLQNVFVAVYCDGRLLCTMYCAIGAVIGYVLDGALYGAIIGAVFGVLNYELVSKKLLHIGEARAENS